MKKENLLEYRFRALSGILIKTEFSVARTSKFAQQILIKTNKLQMSRWISNNPIINLT